MKANLSQLKMIQHRLVNLLRKAISSKEEEICKDLIDIIEELMTLC